LLSNDLATLGISDGIGIVAGVLLQQRLVGLALTINEPSMNYQRTINELSMNYQLATNRITNNQIPRQQKANMLKGSPTNQKFNQRNLLAV